MFRNIFYYFCTCVQSLFYKISCTGNKANSCTPTKVGDDLGRIVEVAATHYNHISAAITQVICIV